MDIKEVLKTKVGTAKVQELQHGQKHLQHSERLQSTHESKQHSISDRVDLKAPSHKASDAREKANVAVSISNVASVATEEIGKMLASINGIVEQASASDISDRQLELLEREANDLVAAIKNIATSTHSNGVNPLAGDKIKLEVEEKLGKTLEFILPDNAIDGFGLGEIRFSPKDLIIATITKVSVAQEQLKQLRQAIHETGAVVKNTVAKMEVLMRNNEAADTSVADVDEALHLAEKTKKGISTNPEIAIGSIGGFSRRSVDLLD